METNILTLPKKIGTVDGLPNKIFSFLMKKMTDNTQIYKQIEERHDRYRESAVYTPKSPCAMPPKSLVIQYNTVYRNKKKGGVIK